jgi:hypothetical protein
MKGTELGHSENIKRLKLGCQRGHFMNPTEAQGTLQGTPSAAQDCIATAQSSLVRAQEKR